MLTDRDILDRIQRKVLWLSTWMVHHANTLRPNPDGLKVGGHQASSASVVSLLTALYFKALQPGHVVAVKAHAAPAFYAAQFLRGRLPASALSGLRVLGGLQAYPSRRKNPEIVDLTTGSMGLGAVQATFGALATRYLADHGAPATPERFIVMVGDAELDEGNVWEALAEEMVAELGNVLWIVDVNRQSLDRIVPDARRRHLPALFEALGWRVIELRWGGRLQEIFARPDGTALRARLDAMPYAEYQSLLRQGPASVRKALITGPAGEPDRAIDRLLASVPDEALPALVADVGGHDLDAILNAFAEAEAERARPTVILAHTIKGWGLPLAGDPLNHTALLTTAQIEELRAAMGVAPGAEWDGFPEDSPEAALDPDAASAVHAARVPSARWRRAGGPGRHLGPPAFESGSLRPRARCAQPAAGGRFDRDRVRRRGRDNASGRVDQSQGDLLSPGPAQLLRRRAPGRAVAGIRAGSAHRARASRSTIYFCCWAPWGSRASWAAPRCCRSARCTIRSSAAGWTPSTTRSTPAAASSSWPRRPGSRWPRRAEPTNR